MVLAKLADAFEDFFESARGVAGVRAGLMHGLEVLLLGW
jgi:hypothetical protein